MTMARSPRTNTATVEPKAFPLPKGHDDKAGPFFVPEQLRESWGKYADCEDALSHLLINATMNVIAQNEVLIQRYPDEYDGSKYYLQQRPDGKGGHIQQKIVQQKPRHLLWDAAVIGDANGSLMFMDAQDTRRAVDAVLNSNTARIREEAVHAIRLKVVMETHEADRAAEAREVKEYRDFLCPVCGVSDRSQGQPVFRDIVEGKTYGKTIHIKSCGKCFLTAQRQLAERAAAELVGDGWPQKTRGMLVTGHLTAEGL